MQKDSIKREQSQAGLSFAEREKFRPQVKNKLLLLLALLMTAATGAWAQEQWDVVWDFTAWSTETVTALKADAAASKTEGWSDVEKKTDAEAGADPTEAAKDNCFWFAGTVNEDGSLSANGAVIKELKGLKFNSDYAAKRSLAIAVNYPSTSLGDYAGGAYLWLGDKKQTCFTIPGVKAGSKITIEVESNKTSDARGIGLYKNSYAAENLIDEQFKPTAKEAKTWEIAEDCDVVVWNTHSCHIYTIKVKAPAVAPAGYTVSLKDGVKDADKWTVKVGEGQAQALPIGGLKGDGSETVTLQYNGRLKVKGVKATSEAAPAEEPVTLGTPLTMEAVTPGTIQVNIGGTLQTGMKYSVNGGTKTTITETTVIGDLKAGDKVQFYGNGTQTQVYGGYIEVSIQGGGDGFKTKVYGNIMSLLDEEAFATKTDLPNAEYVFYGLFKNNATLIDASELLLPATTLAEGCYQLMFESCTSLTTAPKLPATTLDIGCYLGMFSNCTSLTNAYVKVAYTEGANECSGMFDGSTATGAVLHTTPDSKPSWQDMMGPNKDWENWSVADDWQD